MRWWPRRLRKRSGDGYTDALTKLLIAQASGQAVGDATGLAVVQAAAGLLGRVLGAATVSPPGARTAPISPHWLRDAGRQLVVRGETVYLIRVDSGAVMLDQASSWDVDGGRQTWRYRLTLAAPSATYTTSWVPANRVVHLRYHTDPAQPWRGLSPVAAASSTSTLAARIEAMLAAESGGPSGYLLPIPDSKGAAPPNLATLKGGSALVPSEVGGWTGGAGGPAPRRDWQTIRFGFTPPVGIRELRWDVQASLMAAHGVPVELLVERAGGGADRRAAWAEYVASEAKTVADGIAAELAAKLDAPGLVIDLSALVPREPLAQARMVKTLTDAGMALDQARQAAGLA